MFELIYIQFYSICRLTYETMVKFVCSNWALRLVNSASSSLKTTNLMCYASLQICPLANQSLVCVWVPFFSLKFNFIILWVFLFSSWRILSWMYNSYFSSSQECSLLFYSVFFPDKYLSTVVSKCQDICLNKQKMLHEYHFKDEEVTWVNLFNIADGSTVDAC